MADVPEAGAAKRPAGLAIILLFSVFVVATCGLIYELLAGTLASYLLGDSVTQFSTIIGTYLFAMGVGSWCSRYVKRNRADRGLVGGAPFPALSSGRSIPSGTLRIGLAHRDVGRAGNSALDPDFAPPLCFC
jgi:predicted membrane-bound spermidine synthase